MTNRQCFQVMFALAGIVGSGASLLGLPNPIVFGVDAGLLTGVILIVLGRIRIVPTIGPSDLTPPPVYTVPSRRRDPFLDPLYIEPGTGPLPAHVQHAHNETMCS